MFQLRVAGQKRSARAAQLPKEELEWRRAGQGVKAPTQANLGNQAVTRDDALTKSVVPAAGQSYGCNRPRDNRIPGTAPDFEWKLICSGKRRGLDLLRARVASRCSLP